jgi:hypothetical protein
MTADDHLRVGDAERQASIEQLAEHFRAGRLTDEELDERTAAAHRAVTRGDLATLEDDLPSLRATPTPARRSVPARPEAPDDQDDDRELATRRGRSRRPPIGPVAVVVAFLWLIWALTGAGYPWPVWPMLGMGLPLALHLVTGRHHGRPELRPPRRPLDRGPDR